MYRLKCYRAVTGFLLLSCMLVIFIFSSQNAVESDKISTGFIEKTAAVVYPNYDSLTNEEKTEIVDSFQFTVRKCAHFSIYTLLGFLSFLTFVSYYKIQFKWRVIIASVLCLLYASSDEIHQLFVPGRSGEIRDVCIDFCGSMLAITICLMVSRFNKRVNKSVRWSVKNEG